MQIFPEFLVSDGKCFHRTAVTDAVKFLYNKENAFTGSFSYNNSTKKEKTGLSDIQIINQEDCNALRKIAQSQQRNLSPSEVKDAVSFIHVLSRIVTRRLLK